MNNLMKKIVDTGIGSIINKRTDPLFLEDDEYQQDCKDLDDLEARYMKLELSISLRRIIDDYIACFDTANCRAHEIYYTAGVRDAILFFYRNGLIKVDTSK